jgi:hypothetical protein
VACSSSLLDEFRTVAKKNVAAKYRVTSALLAWKRHFFVLFTRMRPHGVWRFGLSLHCLDSVLGNLSCGKTDE